MWDEYRVKYKAMLEAAGLTDVPDLATFVKPDLNRFKFTSDGMLHVAAHGKDLHLVKYMKRLLHECKIKSAHVHLADIPYYTHTFNGYFVLKKRV